jgi:hypothetical protein
MPPIVAGVLGNQRSSPFKAFDPDKAVSRLEPPVTKTRSHRSKTIPTIEQFLKVKVANELKQLKGSTTGENIDGLTNWPTSYIIHPKIFILLGGVQSLRADDAAIIIINGIKEVDKQDLVFTNERNKTRTRKKYDCSSKLEPITCVTLGHPNKMGTEVVSLADPPDV